MINSQSKIKLIVSFVILFLLFRPIESIKAQPSEPSDCGNVLDHCYDLNPHDMMENYQSWASHNQGCYAFWFIMCAPT